MAVSCPTYFPLEAIIFGLTLCDKRTTHPHPEIYPQNLSIKYLVKWGSKKQQRRGWDYSNFRKGEKCHLGYLDLAPSFTASSKKDIFPVVWPSREYTLGLIWKNLSDLFFPYPHSQSRMRTMNTSLIISRYKYVRPLLRPKNV